ncbi:hypothetical protein [Mycolicibacterium sp.]|uniref:hypothetical protein n=1 Tax=Mycolicibacterium sp. TaxID=2320850 RepID=UPI003D145263
MPTTTEPSRAGDLPTRGPLRARSSAISILAASATTLVVVFGVLNSPREDTPNVQSVPAQPNTVGEWVAAPARPSTTAPQPPPQPPAPAVDGLGFVDSAARCEPGQRAVAIARTARSALVVCRDADGTFDYAGVRLHDGAALRLDDVRAIPAGFEARNDGTTYRLSPTELVVITGEELLSRDAVVDYRAG